MSKLDSLILALELIQNKQLGADPRMVEVGIDYLATICNGCGPAGAKLDLVPDHIWRLYIGHVCHIHDFDYSMGTTEADRKFADDRLKANLTIVIANGSSILYPARRVRVESIYRAVRLGGEAPFWARKESNIITLGTYA